MGAAPLTTLSMQTAPTQTSLCCASARAPRSQQARPLPRGARSSSARRRQRVPDGGATAITYGWRELTIDIDLRLDPEPPGAFEAIARLKDELDVNVELASPMDFLPEVPGWRERSVLCEVDTE
ncbi:MAG: hypothetical protein M5U28_31025 [Sandaracinaceae bacterium]|nr:hypothetical protein [Sandaracinaceae bacterium]